MPAVTEFTGPFDPRCGRFAAEMEFLDYAWAASYEEVAALTETQRRERRARYARTDGTYNPENGHFLCDKCYIDVGTPSAPGGWVCP